MLSLKALKKISEESKKLDIDVDEELVSRVEELTKLRKSISLDLKSIAVATKISTYQLKNIEGLRFEKLPPHPMRTSFINQYCNQIQIAKKTV